MDIYMDIRIETAADLAGIRSVEEDAFPTRSEADLVDQLRTDGDAEFSLVAVQEDEIVGHAMLSRMRAPPETLGLGPVAVSTPHRRKGIASSLIREGLRRATEKGWKGVFVLGDPAYYCRFGFNAALAAGFTSRYSGPHLMALALQNDGLPIQKGSLEHPAAFAALE
jgi:putative acetyltransferase